jgi:hypothetical protein
MGRYYNIGSQEGKFWFGIQPTEDLLEFSTKQGENLLELKTISRYSKLNKYKQKLTTLKGEFIREFHISYSFFMAKIDEKGYLIASNDAETNTKKWARMSRLASLISLGTKIINELELVKDDVFCEGEW